MLPLLRSIASWSVLVSPSMRRESRWNDWFAVTLTSFALLSADWNVLSSSRLAAREVGEHRIDLLHLALALIEQLLDRRGVRALRLLVDRQHLARQHCDRGGGVGGRGVARRVRRGDGRHDLQRGVAGERRLDQEARVARDVDGIVDRQDHLDREVFGDEARLVDDADDDAALVHERALVQAGGGLEVDADLVAPAGPDVRENEEEPEEPEQGDDGEDADDCLSVHDVKSVSARLRSLARIAERSDSVTCESRRRFHRRRSRPRTASRYDPPSGRCFPGRATPRRPSR